MRCEIIAVAGQTMQPCRWLGPRTIAPERSPLAPPTIAPRRCLFCPGSMAENWGPSMSGMRANGVLGCHPQIVLVREPWERYGDKKMEV